MKNNKIQDRVILITGGSSGIGHATALAFAREHAQVAITYKGSADAAAQVVAEIEKEGGEGLAIAMDLSDHASIKAASEKVIEQWGHIDVLVANAVNWGSDRMQPSKHIEDISLGEWQTMVDINLIGTIASVQAVLPGMRKQKSGRIILLSSDVTHERMPGLSHYVSAKGALNAILAAFAADFGPDGITANIVLPGFTTTERMRSVPEQVKNMVLAQTPTGRLSAPEDIASAIVFLASTRAKNITGEMLKVNGGK